MIILESIGQWLLLFLLYRERERRERNKLINKLLPAFPLGQPPLSLSLSPRFSCVQVIPNIQKRFLSLSLSSFINPLAHPHLPLNITNLAFLDSQVSSSFLPSFPSKQIPLMGNHSSKKPSTAPDAPPPPPPQSPPTSLPVKDLTSYLDACRTDPDLQTFDTTLQQRMSRAISTLAVGVEVRSLSFDSLKEVTGCLLDMNQEVVKVILHCKKDIWNTPDLFELVEDYFDNSLQTLDFCAELERCLKKARDTQLILQVALQHFDDDVDQRGKRYTRTLEELKHFKETGDPFTEEFFMLFQSVYTQQILMLEKLQIKKAKLDKKLRSVKAWRKLSSIIFVSAFAAVLICSVVAAAVAAPPVAAALAAATSIPIGSMGKWFDSLWKNYEDAMRAQKEMVLSMQTGTYVAIKDMDSIRLLIDRLETQIGSLLRSAEFAMEEEAETVRFAVEEIRRMLEGFMKSVEELGEQADRCSRDIRRARTVVLQRIIRQ